MRLALVHYAAPPIVGGVERILGQQAALFCDHGHEVLVVCGNADAALPDAGREGRISVHCLPGLAAGGAGSAHESTPIGELRELLTGGDVVIVHNMLTMPFRWEASKALAKLSQDLPQVRFINWVHDVDVSAADFAALNLRATHVAVSKVRQREFCRKMKLPRAACRVVPNGLDLCATLGLTPSVTEFARRHRLMEREIVLLHPTRVLARKNIELGLAVTAALRGMGQDAVYVVTGAPDPHRKSSAAYATSLQERIVELGLEEAVLFVSATFPVGGADVASLYRMADALFFPSRTEGFGLPLLEAMLHRLPVICSDIPPHREVAGNAARYFSLDTPPETVAGTILRVLAKDSRRSARRRVQGRFGWQYIYKEYLEPLIKER